jgi:hypothetical protein
VLAHARPQLAFDGCEFNLRAALQAIARRSGKLAAALPGTTICVSSAATGSFSSARHAATKRQGGRSR